MLVTEWHELRTPGLRAAQATLMRARVLFDGRNVWQPNEARAPGFTYYGIGRRGYRATCEVDDITRASASARTAR